MKQILKPAVLVSCLVAPGVQAQVLHHDDMCEASAAALLPDGRYAVASDDMDFLAVYTPGNPKPEWSADVGGVSDMEGAARIGDTVFWITSHSLTAGPPREDKKNRKKLLATQTRADGIPDETGDKRDDLRPRLAGALATVLPGVAIDDRTNSPLNIEGLAATPGGSLLIGLRAPLTEDGRAAVVRISQPFALLDLPQPEAEKLEDAVFRVDLGGRGIRSMEADPAGGYLIIAGPEGEGDEPFALYRWDGVGEEAEDLGVDLSDLNPEALIVLSPGVVQIFSDNGENACSDDDDDADPRPRWFHSRIVTLAH